MAKSIRRDFIFPKDFRDYVLNVYVEGCNLDFQLRLHGKVRIRNYSKTTKIKKLQAVEMLDGWAIGFNVVELNLDFCKPLARRNFIRHFKMGLEPDQFEEDFALTHQLVKDFGWKTKVRKQWKFMV